MKLAEQLPKILIIGIVLGGVAIIGSKFIKGAPGALIVDVKVPRLSQMASRGKQAFNANCVQCHGSNAAGSEQGPPLVHDIYNPGHHGDESFWLATQRGVQRHHWSFGNMPAQPQINEQQMGNIVRYVRELQVANGVFRRKHKM